MTTSEEEAIGVFIELENEKPTEHTPRIVSSFLQPLESSVYFIFFDPVNYFETAFKF